MKTMYGITDGHDYASFASKYRGVEMSIDIDNAQLYKTKSTAQKIVDFENAQREQATSDIPLLSVIEINVTRSL